MAWYDPAVSYASGGLNRLTGQNYPIALYQRLMDVITILGGTDGTTRTGVLKMPNQPSFLAYNSVTDTNQTGAGTTATVDFDTEVFDRANNFSADTFTAPVTGLYHLQAHVIVSDLTAAMTDFTLSIITSNRTYRTLVAITPIVSGNQTLIVDVLADMDAADTATVTVRVANGAGDTADVLGAATLSTWFSGALVA